MAKDSSVIGTERHRVAIALTDAELIETSRNLQRKLNEQTSLEADKAEVTARLGGKIKAVKKEIAELGTIVGSGKRWEDVDCTIRKNYRNNRVETIRPDTGEIVAWRVMTVHDRQMSIGEIKPDIAPAKKETPKRTDKPKPAPKRAAPAGNGKKKAAAPRPRATKPTAPLSPFADDAERVEGSVIEH
jgi:ribosomal protein L29